MSPDDTKVVPIRQEVDITKPHWRCRCGAVAMPLTDDTNCLCQDIYEQEWTRVELAKKEERDALGTDERM